MTIDFGAFTLDLDTRQLRHRGQEVHLSPKAFDLLAALVAERPKAVTKAELQARLWPDTFVAEANLSNLISELRHALHDLPRSPRFIRTAHGFGYAFCADARASSRARASALFSCWLEWGSRRFPLRPGENVVGRDPDVHVRLDASTVSRRHATIVVGETRAVLDDFGSKNGTFRKADRVTSAVPLADGDIVRFGSIAVTFRARSSAPSTETLAKPLL